MKLLTTKDKELSFMHELVMAVHAWNAIIFCLAFFLFVERRHGGHHITERNGT